LETLYRAFVCGLLVVGLTVGALQVDWSNAGGFFADAYRLPRNLWVMAEQEQRDQKLSVKFEACQQRAARKDAVAEAVLEGRMSLRVAASEYYEASKTAPYEWDSYEATNPEWSVELRCAHHLVDHLTRMVPPEDAEGMNRLAQLRAELEDWKSSPAH
jgi:hypothetical protein